jgi:hypothetical protein
LLYSLDSDGSEGGFRFSDELSKAKQRAVSKLKKPIPPTV